MTRRFILTKIAEQELDEQAAYLAEEAGPSTAVRFYTSMGAACLLLAGNPELGVARDYGRPDLAGLRVWPIHDFDKHLVFYRPTQEGVEIVRVIHASRDIEALFLGKT
jgi:toxin ParE1/3/4